VKQESVMAVLQLVLGPDPILKKKAAPVAAIDDAIKSLVADMFDTLYERKALGMGANMIGELKRIVVIDLQENGEKQPLACINPEITWSSDKTEKREEASLCFPGISAEVSRPDAIRLSYTDLDGAPQSLEADGWLATVLQHEMDYLDGKVYLDYLSKMKRDRLIKKMQKQIKAHSCGDPGCSHEHH
jgi:peptide deformylase